MKITSKSRSESPPNTPQRARIASQQEDRAGRILESPHMRRIPQRSPPLPIPFILPGIQPLPTNNNHDGPDPFVTNPAPASSFTSIATPVLPPGPAPPSRYPNLPAHLAAQLAALPPMLNPRHHRNQRQLPLPQVCFFYS